ncbi:MAG: DegT/DnrJ/EryC1/StrS family aminotransferase [Candidatus Sericytochromatia bacterium]|nr:DegT/DnrJ/EryC1/StrS family aminotransferase [Candidatus Tanganyikabacteria bacterium]
MADASWLQVCDLKRQYQALKPEIDAAVAKVLESGHYIMGPTARQFEQEIAVFLGTPHAVAMNSGTDALHLALRALEIGPGDEVITTAFTFAATSEAIGILGATPVLVDIDPATYNLSPGAVRAAVTPRTRAIIPVHLFGQPADMEPILAMAAERGIAVVEDCAQSTGATWHGRHTGTLGTIGCFSFFPSKNLGAAGDGGMCTTADPALGDRLRMLRSHGWKRKYYQEVIGVNSRLDEIQAAILRVKLPHLPAWNARRLEIARRYDHLLADVPEVVVPGTLPDTVPVFHQYTIRVPRREQIAAAMKEAGIETQVYYPYPLHLLPIHASLGLAQGALPESEKASGEVLSLPIFPELTDAEQDRVVGALKAALRSLRTPSPTP